MKVIVLIFSAIAISLSVYHPKSSDMSKQEYYPEYIVEWSEIKSLIEKGLIEDAQKKLNELYNRAIIDVNHPQIYKALLHIEMLASQKDELGITGIITRLESRLVNIAEPEKSMTQSVLASLYLSKGENYYHRGSKTNIAGTEQDSLDINTWSPDKITKKANDYIQKSIANLGLKKISLEDYKPILINAEEISICPSIYELLLHRAIQYYSNSNTALTDFEESVSDEIAFSTAQQFIISDLKGHPVFTLFQKWLEHLSSQSNSNAYILANLNRLQYALNKDQSSNKLEKYNDALNLFWKEKQNISSSYLILQKLVESRFQTSNMKSINYLEIDSLCDLGLKKFKDSVSISFFNNYKNEIRRPSLNCIQESALPSKEYSKFLVQFRNIDKLYLRIYKLPYASLDDLILRDELKDESSLKKYKLISKWAESWTSPKDFSNHSIELKVDPLELGKYYIIGSNIENIDNATVKSGVQFQVSDLASYQYSQSNDNKIIVVNRLTGNPEKGVKVNFFKQRYDRYDNQNTLESAGSKTTNSDGIVSSPSSNDYLQYYLSKGKDIYTDFSGINGSGRENHYNYKNNYFFTDRSLYRPGQTVYFKLLSIANSSKGTFPTLNKNEKITVRLRNANYQEVGKLDLKTNDFGSASGSFVLPKSGLYGNFQIETEHGGASIQVDEYKRPNFEVKFDSIKTAYKLGDQIKVSGKAVSFNGIPVENSTLKYRVKKNVVEFPSYRSWFPFPQSSELLESGSTTTNEKGEFVIEFNSKISPKDENNRSTINYSIEADVTDLNQETQSGSTSINLSHKKIFLSANINELMLMDKDSIRINCMNIEGNPVDVNFKLVIHSLKNPNKIFKKRLWDAPDLQKYNEKDFKKYFPNEVYKNEDMLENWTIDKKVFEGELKNVYSWILTQKELKLKSNYFKIEIQAVDKMKNSDILITYTSILDSKSDLNYHSPAAFIENKVLEPGQNLVAHQLSINQKYKVYYFIQSIQNNKNAWLNVDKKSSISYKILEEDRGGIQYTGISILNNRVYTFNYQIEVPWSNKNLNIISESFRDKLLPGQEETWTFKIESTKGTKEKYELLASMYDQSIDQILGHNWGFNVNPQYYSKANISSNSVNIVNWNYLAQFDYSNRLSIINYLFPELNTWSILQVNPGHILYDMEPVMAGSAPPRSSRMRSKTSSIESNEAGMDAATTGSANADKLDESKGLDNKGNKNQDPPPVRKNLNETVFFFPHLYSDAEGRVNIKFTMNEALTKWKLQFIAHSVDLKYGSKVLEVVTKKPLQIKPFYPRFFRQSDIISLPATISNLSEEVQKGNAKLAILNASTLEDISLEFISKDQMQSFKVDKDQTIPIVWKIKIPENETRTLLLRYTVQGNNHSDGEENIIPVVSNSKLITETLPLPIKAGQSKTFAFNSLNKLGENGSRPHQFTLEYSSHPVWYAIQVLPYIMEYPHDCSEQIMSRVYANSIGVDVMKRYPKVAAILKHMLDEGQAKSKLLQNQELKSALIEETPWVLQAESETEQMKRVALLMDFNNMNASLQSSVQKLQSRQNADGSFSWFPGYWPDRYMTQHIIVQIAHLKRLGVTGEHMNIIQSVSAKARGYLDYTIKKDYDDLAKLVKEGKARWEDDHLASIQLHYYYVKSLYPDWKSDKTMQSIDNYYQMQIENHWTKRGIYDQGLCAIVSSKNDKSKLAQLIMNSLKQRSLFNDELGRYWKNPWSYYWYQLPVETQALMIELFYDIAKDYSTVDELKTWLLKNKQTQHWGTTKATSEAVYALLAFGDNYTEESKPVDIKLGNNKLDLSTSSVGVWYYKNSWLKSDIKKEFSTIQITNPNKSIAWGAVYYQYFQNLDKVDQSNMKELNLNKELYIHEYSGKKETLKLITDMSKIKTGDKVTARIIIKCDRPMDYVQLKVMRSSGFEPIQQLSGYQYSNGLGYYLSPRDLATDFFISFLPKGTFVLEYDLRASFKGEFSDGITTLQCMYAPEFSAHSKGVKVVIE